MLAQAWMSVPSTEKCSSDKSAATLGCAKHRAQELGRDLALEQPVAVLGEHRHVPHRVVDAQPDEPAEQEIVVQLLHELPLRADRVERLQQQGAQQLLRRDRRPPVQRIELLEIADSAVSAASATGRIDRNGWPGGTRPSQLT